MPCQFVKVEDFRDAKMSPWSLRLGGESRMDFEYIKKAPENMQWIHAWDNRRKVSFTTSNMTETTEEKAKKTVDGFQKNTLAKRMTAGEDEDAFSANLFTEASHQIAWKDSMQT